jgi:hypothetical protein
MPESAQSHKTPKHVIFLGAGASFTSDYPLADGSRQEWLFDPLSPSARAIKLRDAVCQEMQFNHLEPRQNFEEFILKEM